jgi:hypothetical protein
MNRLSSFGYIKVLRQDGFAADGAIERWRWICAHYKRILTLDSASAHGVRKGMLYSLASKNFSPMRLRDGLAPQNYEQRLQEIRSERKIETKQVERLSAILVKKASSAKAGLPDRAA